MPSDEKSETKLPVQNLVLLASAVLGAVWLYEGPLKSSRPVEELSSQRLEVVGDRRVQARLWQDPFDAVSRHRDVEKQNGKLGHTHSLRDLVEERVHTDISQVTVLALLTDGAPYADPAESRLRQRYAVLAGLERSGFDPVDGEHIRFFVWPKEEMPAAVCQDSKKALLDWRDARVPVEWYESSAVAPSQALVLWIKDQDLGRCPVASLETMRRIVSKEFEDQGKTITFKVIGPRFSGTLASMVSEATRSKPREESVASTSGPRDNLLELEVYSPWSTVPEKGIYKGKKGVADILRDANVSFQRVVPTDDRLMFELVEELGRRGIALRMPCVENKRCASVALISEWDTRYGRALPKEFKEAVRAGDQSETDEAFDRRIRQFSYLRGLDGELPKEKGKDGQGDASQGDDKAPPSLNERRKLTEQLERPEGRSQLDYVRRLVQVLKEAEAEASCGILKGRCPGFKAIGVLGSDVYDKLLILQALKQNFPHVIFFTTDLDARLFHPREMPWTRNLVVASHFGLTLNKKLQKAIPPFRDTYQTATFYAVLRALGALAPGDLCSAGLQELPVWRYAIYAELRTLGTLAPGDLCPVGPLGPPVWQYAIQPLGGQATTYFVVSPQPRLHEIGKNGPVDLSIERVSFRETQIIQSIHEPRPQPPSADDARKAVAYVAMAVAVGWLLLLLASETVYGVTRSACRTVLSNPPRILGMLAIFGAMSWLLWFAVVPSLVADHEAGEPFSFLDGVSIWPSQLLRGAVIVLAFVFIVRIRKRLRNTCEEIERSFYNLLVPRAHVAYASVPMLLNLELLSRFARLARWSRWGMPWSVNSWSLSDLSAEPADIWVEYRTRLKPLFLWGRVLCCSVIFLLVGQFIMDLYGQPATPFRGNVVWQVNKLVLIAAVFMMIVVIFLVLDLTRTTSVFVRKLVTKELGCASPTDCLNKLQLVARVTARIDVFVYYPATLMGLMLLARAEYFDNWNFSIGLGIVVGVGAAYVVASAIRLRASSEEARRLVMNELSERRLAGLEPASSQQLDQIMATIGMLREGAFLPYAELPVFRAVALPSGAYGLFAVIELMTNSF
ncbi:MAG: hypothetical protein HOO98_13500 [Nitrospira sp.]|nr:hypothetical protein [Nitrospira sp.]